MWRPRPFPDPVYQGKSASAWFRQMATASSQRWNRVDERSYFTARQALLRLGTNAVPLLVDRTLHPPANGIWRRAMGFAARGLDLGLDRGTFLPPAEIVG